MKRTLLGVLVMSSMVGFGSVGVYYAQQKLAPAAPAGDAVALAEDDRTPHPIPVRDPYANAETPVEPVAHEPRPLNPDPSASEMPSASQLAMAAEPAAEVVQTSGSPFGHARTVSNQARYAEQPAAAAMAEEEQPAEAEAAVAEEPEPLPQEPAPTGDRYAETAEENPPGELEPAAEEPAPVEPQTVEPQAEEPAPLAAPGKRRAIADEVPRDAEPVAEAATNEGTGRPGDPQLSGSQAPALTIEKVAPPEIQLGKAAKFTIKVRNAGTATAHGVEIHDAIPQGTQLIDTNPAAKRLAEGQLLWELGSLKPGEEQTVDVQLMPTAEGEIGSVATVHFRAEASVRTLATKPMLHIEVLGPTKINKGEDVTLRIKLSNPGSGAAQGVVLTENVPEGLSHEAGKELEFEVGTLKPGESRELDLTLHSTKAGMVMNSITAEGEANLKAEAKTELEVVAPQLQVALTGPKRRYLERNATHNISISNPGTAAAKDIELSAVLPRTLKFVNANNGGQFDEATHTVYWSLEELPPQETGTVTLTTLPLEAGDAKLLIKSSAQSGLKDETEESLAIEGLAAINFHVADVKDPVEVGGDTAYEVKVTNQGTKASANVQIAALLPPGMKPVSAEGPVRYKVDGQRVVFEPLKQLAPKADTTMTIKCKALEPGDMRIQVQITTDELRDPITKEESTRVYGDE